MSQAAGCQRTRSCIHAAMVEELDPAGGDPASTPPPSHVEVRRWGWFTFAAYVFHDGDTYGRFVGTATTRDAADMLGKCCDATPPAARGGRLSMRDLGAGLEVPAVARPTAASPSDTPGEERRR